MIYAPRALKILTAASALALLGACSAGGGSAIAPFEAGEPSARELAYTPNRPLVMPPSTKLPEPGGISIAAGARIGSAEALREAASAMN